MTLLPADDTAAHGLSRRTLLATLGAGSALASAGCLGAPTVSGDQSGGDAAVDPLYGFSAQMMDEEPPVEPNHVVAARIRPRESGPIPEFYFEPVGLAIEPGDVVQFAMETPHHNVVAYHAAFGYAPRVPAGVSNFSSPTFGPGGYWLYRFDAPGVYDYNCAPHELFGMAGRIVAGEATGPGAEPIDPGAAGPNARVPEMTAGLVLSDPALAPDAVLSAGSVSWDDIAPENKRLLMAPVEGGHSGHDSSRLQNRE